MTKEELQELTERTQANGNSESFEYIDDNTHLHVKYAGFTCHIALLYRGETITRSQCHITLLHAVIDDYRAAYAHTEGGETA